MMPINYSKTPGDESASSYATHRITALTTHFSGEQSKIALAETDFYDHSQLYFSVYDRKEDGEIAMAMKRVHIQLPEDEIMSPMRRGTGFGRVMEG